tara:strand:+ start:377724 stop:378035 length:312 start_codon:yes stop_codon:yes gene_type:complete
MDSFAFQIRNGGGQLGGIVVHDSGALQILQKGRKNVNLALPFSRSSCDTDVLTAGLHIEESFPVNAPALVIFGHQLGCPAKTGIYFVITLEGFFDKVPDALEG